MPAQYRERSSGCIFCNIDAARIIGGNELMVAIRDAFPVTRDTRCSSRSGTSLARMGRITVSPNDLFQPELNAMWALSAKVRSALSNSDSAITSFNFGSNDGAAAGQTVMHAHFHVIPRRAGDNDNPRGGVRGVVPGDRAIDLFYPLSVAARHSRGTNRAGHSPASSLASSMIKMTPDRPYWRRL